MSALYIHIPFCRQACHYCDFHFSTSDSTRKPTIDAIATEIGLRRGYLPELPLRSIYFGGGTPSLLNAAELNQLFEAIHKHFTIAPNAEITLEANPDDLNIEKIRLLRTTPINRLSIGIQSFDDAQLKLMNRAHNAEQAKTCVKTAQDAGFERLSIDLIFALPNLTNQLWIETLQQAVALNTSHISVYGLTIEQGTALYKMVQKGLVMPQADDAASQHFLLALAHLQKNGLEQYEISSYAKHGDYAVHNSSYWQNRPYLGVGPSAHSYNGESRQWNVSSNLKYVKSLANGGAATIEILSPTDKANEYILTRLRTSGGIVLEEFGLLFGTENLAHLHTEMQNLDKNWFESTPKKIALSTQGKLLADYIASQLFL